MDDERLRFLLAKNDFDICMEFLARMIEKYANQLDVENIKEEKIYINK